MVGPDQLSAQLPTTHDSSSKPREVNVEGQLRRIFLGTCTIAAGNYALFFTGRIPLDGMAEKIERDTERLLRSGNISITASEGQSQNIGSFAVYNWLTQEENTPVLGVIYRDNDYTWRDYLSRWFKARGVALIGSGDHMRTLVMREDSGQIIEVETNGERKPLTIEALSDQDVQEYS